MLSEAGAARRYIFSDVTSGARTAAPRPGMHRPLEYAEANYNIVVWRIDRLGRSLLDPSDVAAKVAIVNQACADGRPPRTHPTGRMVMRDAVPPP